MALTTLERETQRSYDCRFEEWLAHSGGRKRGYWLTEMDKFVKLLEKEALVLEAGCGPATDAKYLDQRGVRTASIDYSLGMLRLAQELNSAPSLFQMDIYNLGFKDNSFAGFWATASLLHLEKPKEALLEIARVVKLGGVGFISLKEGEGSLLDSKTGFFFRYYSEREFAQILNVSGWEIVSFQKRESYADYDWLEYWVRLSK